MFNVVVDTDGLEMGHRSLILGGAYVVIGDVPFPEEGWSDFPVVILAWWLEAAARLLEAPYTAECCFFMDGPYHFELIDHGGDSWRVRYFESRAAGESCTGDFEVGEVEVVRELMRAANQVLRECHARGWMTRDIETLRRAGARLRRADRSR
jgi:hypothetical protein